MPLRQTTGFVESLLRLAGLDWKVPDFSTLCRRQKTLNVSIPYRGGSGPLHLLIDATGIKAEGEGEWNARKHGGSKKRLWRKLHLGMDEETLEIRAVGVTTSNVGDAPMLPDLLEQIPPDQDIATVTADGAYDTRRCHNVIAARGAAAIIPPRKNAQLWKPTTAGAIARNEAVRACKYLGRALWRKLTGYHRRSRAETKMNCVKLLGQGLMARDFDRQVAELQVRIAVLNRYTALHPSAQECPTLEANHGGRHRAKRSCEGVQVSRKGSLAKVDGISPPEPRRDQDELRQTPWPTWPHGRETSTGRLLSSRSGLRYSDSTATPLSDLYKAYLSQSP